MRYVWLFNFSCAVFSMSLATWLLFHHVPLLPVLANYGAAFYNALVAAHYYTKYNN